MRMVGLDPNEKKSFRKYSLGMKQKLGIAAAMMEDPQILVLDEPFNALDEASCENVKKMILSAKPKPYPKYSNTIAEPITHTLEG